VTLEKETSSWFFTWFLKGLSHAPHENDGFTNVISE